MEGKSVALILMLINQLCEKIIILVLYKIIIFVLNIDVVKINKYLHEIRSVLVHFYERKNV